MEGMLKTKVYPPRNWTTELVSRCPTPICLSAYGRQAIFPDFGLANEGDFPGIGMKFGFVQLIRDELLYLGMQLLICQWSLHVHARKTGPCS